MLPCHAVYRLSLLENSVGTLWWFWEKWPETFLLCSFFGPDSAWPPRGNPCLVTAVNGCSKSPEHLSQKCFHSCPILVNRNTRNQSRRKLCSCLLWRLCSQGSKEVCSFLRYKIPIDKTFFWNLYMVGTFSPLLLLFPGKMLSCKCRFKKYIQHCSPFPNQAHKFFPSITNQLLTPQD